MKRLLLATILSIAALTSNATVINFDNVGALQNDYSQIGTHQGFMFQTDVVAVDTVGSDWNYGAVSGDFTMLNNHFSAIVVRAVGDVDFTFDGLWAKTWGSLAARGGAIRGYNDNNSVPVFSSSVTVTPDFSYFSGFSGKIDRLEIDLGHYFLVDDLALNAQQVPEPASLALLGLGLAGIAAARRRKKQA